MHSFLMALVGRGALQWRRIACLTVTISWPAFLLGAALNGEHADGADLVERDAADVAAVVAREQETVRRLRADLKNAAAPSAPISAEMLERARLEVEDASTRRERTQGRIAEAQQTIGRLEDEIAALETHLGALREAEEIEAAGAAVNQVLDRKRALKSAQAALVEALQELETTLQAHIAAAGQWLGLLQKRFQLDDAGSGARDGAQEEAIRPELDDLRARALTLRERARGVVGDTPAANARRRLLRLQAQDATERIQLKQQAVRLRGTEGSIESLHALTDAIAVPSDTLKTARAQLDDLGEALHRERETLTRKLTLLADQRAIVDQRASAGELSPQPRSAQLEVVDALIASVRAQHEWAKALLEAVAETRTRLSVAIGERLERELLTRRSLPASESEWTELAAALAALPWQVAERLMSAGANLGKRLAHTSARGVLLLLAAELLLLALALKLRQWLDRRVLQHRHDGAIAVPVRGLHDTLLGLVPPGALVFAGWALELERADLLLLLTPLLIWPGVKFAVKFCRLTLLEHGSRGASPARLRLYREVRWVCVLVGILVAVIVVAHAVAVAPALADALDRLTMLLLLIVALPALHLRALVMPAQRANAVSARLWLRTAGAFMLIVPLALTACALIGLSGYMTLAWTIIEYLAWLALVAAAWMLARGLLRDGVRLLSQTLIRSPIAGPFWVQNVVTPAYQLVNLALLAAAGAVLLRLYEWDAQTPVVRWIPGLLSAKMFSLGDSSVEVYDLLIGGVIFWGVVWLAGWTKRVSYRFAFSRIGDRGIRESLAKFTQYLVVIFGLMIGLKTLGLDLTALTVFAGALGVGIGFGLQNIANNFMSGILLLIERPLRVTDIVNVDKYEGEVTDIGIRSLTVKTWDNQDVVIPNSAVISQPFVNWTRGDDVQRSVLMVGISYDDDPHEAVGLIDRVVAEHPATLDDPAFQVLLWEFGDSAILIRLQYYTHVLGRIGLLDTRSQILFGIWDAFKSAGIRIPYPQRDLHVRMLPAGEPSEPMFPSQRDKVVELPAGVF